MTEPVAGTSQLVKFFTRFFEFARRQLDRDVERDAERLREEASLTAALAAILAAHRQTIEDQPDVRLIRAHLDIAVREADAHAAVRRVLVSVLPVIAQEDGEYSAHYFKRWIEERMRSVSVARRIRVVFDEGSTFDDMEIPTFIRRWADEVEEAPAEAARYQVRWIPARVRQRGGARVRYRVLRLPMGAAVSEVAVKRRRAKLRALAIDRGLPGRDALTRLRTG